MEQSDNSLIDFILNGDKECFRILIDRYKERVFYVGKKFFSNPADAEDFSQEVFIRVYERLGSYRGRGSFAAWIYRLAFNLAVNKYHIKKRTLFEGELPEETASHAYIPEEKVLDSLYKEKIREELKVLPPGYQLVFNLHYFEGFTYPEISNITGFPVGTIKSHIYRGKNLLKERLAVYEYE